MLSMLTAQLIGSNTAFVCIAGITSIVLIHFFVLMGEKHVEYKHFKVSFFALLLGAWRKKLFVAIACYTGILSIAVVFLFFYFENNVGQFRITGFGEGSLSSIDSRVEIFRNNFIQHLAYNPVFGNAQVEKLTTGEGSYVHSLLSIATHLGIVGAALFATLIARIYKEINLNGNSWISLSGNTRYSLFRFLILGFILLYSLVATFYTWLPLWFSLGAFGLSAPHKYYKLKLEV